MQILIIRHGQSENNKLYADTGEAAGRVGDPGLTPLGWAQAQNLADGIGTRGIPTPTHLYSSLMLRTIQTATPLAEKLDMPIIARTDTFECSGPYLGPWEDHNWFAGSSRSALQAVTERVRLPEAATEDGWFSGPFEVDDMAKHRAVRVLNDIRAHHVTGDVVALVTHGCFGAFLIQAALNTEAFCYQYNTAHTLIQFDADGLVEAHWLNRGDHLDADQLTGTGIA